MSVLNLVGRLCVLFGVCLTLTVVNASAQSVTQYDSGAVTVYSVKDSLPSDAPIMPAREVAPERYSAPFQPKNIVVSQNDANKSDRYDSSYGSSDFYIVGVDPEPQLQRGGASVDTPFVPKTVVPAPVVMSDDVSLTAYGQSSSVSSAQNTLVQTQPVNEMVINEVSEPLSVPMPEPMNNPQTPSIVSVMGSMSNASAATNAQNCSLNESLMDKITLLEREKEMLRSNGLMGIASEVKALASCASEQNEIQTLKARIAYLEEENETLKRLSNNRVEQSILSSEPLKDELLFDDDSGL